MQLVGFSQDGHTFHPLTCWGPKENQKILAPGGSEKQPEDSLKTQWSNVPAQCWRVGYVPFNILILENQINVYQRSLIIFWVFLRYKQVNVTLKFS